MQLEDSMNITYDILDKNFQIVDTENVSVTQIIPRLSILLTKSECDNANTVKKSTVHNLASIHFQLCFKYIIPCFTVLCHQILNLAMGSNFHIASSSRPAIIASHFAEQPLIEQ